MTSRLLLLFLGLATAVLRADDPALLVEARQARAEAIPQVAVQKLRTLLRTGDLPAEIKHAARYELAASLLAAEELDEAESTVQPLAETGDVASRLLQAEIFTHEGRWADALPVYQALASSAELGEAAQLGTVECFQGLGRIQHAATALEKLTAAYPANTGARLRLASLWIDLKKMPQAEGIVKNLTVQTVMDEKWKRYLEGRLLLAQDQAAPAMAIFDELQVDPTDLTESLSFGAVLGSTEARAVLNGFETADNVLERFIAKHGESGYLEEAFRRLDEIYAQEERPSDSELRKWASKTPPRRAALAKYYLARMYRQLHKTDKALATLDTFAQAHPTSPLLNSVYLLQADLYLDKGNLPSALRALDEAMRRASNDEERAEIELRTALVHYRQGESLLAENSFHRAAQGSEKLKVNATFDAALAALDRRNYESFFKDYRDLSSLAPSSPLNSSLVLEEGFAEARFGDPRAGDTIELFLHHFPKHPRQNEARVALAELALDNGDKSGAAHYLQVVNSASPDAETAERAAYLAVFLADAEAPPNAPKLIELGRKFLHDFPHSTYLPDVRMKLGQIYFSTGDHANAETQFTLLARETPNGAYTETALFLAGQAATKWLDSSAVDRALRLFDEVVKRDGPLKLYARQQQAIVQGKLGKESEAVTIYDAILSAQPPPDPELRFAALCSKGDNLAALGRKDPAQFDAAIAVYESLAALPDVTPVWRNQALYKKGRALEQLSRDSEALTAYYDVLDKSVAEGREFFWFYKAGFDAAHLFEEEENWKAAIGIYQKMTKIEGPRAAEARARLSQLRLEKFIWD
ncbi:MAG: tetratricopeptide repeat protein [Chthoniobacter sp.]|uniref:tetratricopeptide repeat protein n=1 Tax=Chthoniobacter sp. TaxID=2510640 RepID=UPI0032AD820A